MEENVTLRSRRVGSPVAANIVRVSDNKTLFSPDTGANDSVNAMEEFNTPPPNSFVKPPPVHVAQDSVNHNLFASSFHHMDRQENSASDWCPSYGDIVWLQTHSTFPYWPAYVCDPEILPAETKIMASAAIGHTALGKSPSNAKKFALYMYASELYEIAKVSQMKEYSTHCHEYSNQDVDGSFKRLFPQALQIAAREYSLPSDDRIKFILYGNAIDDIGHHTVSAPPVVSVFSHPSNIEYPVDCEQTSMNAIHVFDQDNEKKFVSSPSLIISTEEIAPSSDSKPNSPTRVRPNLTINTEDVNASYSATVTPMKQDSNRSYTLSPSASSWSPSNSSRSSRSPSSSVTSWTPSSSVSQSPSNSSFFSRSPHVNSFTPTHAVSKGMMSPNVSSVVKPGFNSIPQSPLNNSTFSRASGSSGGSQELSLHDPPFQSSPHSNVNLIEPSVEITGSTSESIVPPPSDTFAEITDEPVTVAAANTNQCPVDKAAAVDTSIVSKASTNQAPRVIRPQIVTTNNSSLFFDNDSTPSLFSNSVRPPSVITPAIPPSMNVNAVPSKPIVNVTKDGSDSFPSTTTGIKQAVVAKKVAVANAGGSNLFNDTDSGSSSGLFSSTPVVPNASNIFSAPAAVQHGNSNLFAAPAPLGATARVQSNNTDIFSQAPKVDPLPQPSFSSAPPSAPGIKRVSNAAPTIVPKPVADTSNVVAPIAAMKQAPPGMIATPHGFRKAETVAPTIQKVAQPVADATSPTPTINFIPGSNIPVAPGVKISAERAQSAGPPTSIKTPVMPGTNPYAGASAKISVANSTGKSNYGRPACPLVSFGFGGQVVVMFPQKKDIINPAFLTPDIVEKPYKAGHLRTYRLHSLITSNANSSSSENSEIMHLLHSLTAFPGPLNNDKQILVSDAEIKQFINHILTTPVSSAISTTSKYFNGPNVCSRDKFIVSEKLLWGLLLAVAEHNGSIKSSLGIADPGSIETSLVNLLLGVSNTNAGYNSMVPGVVTAESAQIYSGHTLQSPQVSPYNHLLSNRGDVISTIEGLLLTGKREEAIELAICNNDWSLALLIGSAMGTTRYQQLVRQYADHSFPKHSPVHLMSMLFSNQGTNTISNTGNTEFQAATTTPVSALLSAWRRNLAAILANKVGDWDQSLQALGDRLLSDSSDIMAAHFAYIASGCLSSTRSKYNLVGCDTQRRLNHRYIADCVSVSSLRMTEILEWAICKGLSENRSSTSASSGSSGGGLLGGIASLFGSKDKSLSEAGATSTPRTDPNVNTSEYFSAQQFLRMRQSLCPYKLRFAQTLADLGYVREAAAYALDVKAVVEICGAQGAPPSTKQRGVSFDNSEQLEKFPKKFVDALNIFIERLKCDSSSAATAASSSSSNSIWGNVLNVLSNDNLKQLVENPTDNVTKPRGPSFPTAEYIPNQPASEFFHSEADQSRNNQTYQRPDANQLYLSYPSSNVQGAVGGYSYQQPSYQQPADNEFENVDLGGGYNAPNNYNQQHQQQQQQQQQYQQQYPQGNYSNPYNQPQVNAAPAQPENLFNPAQKEAPQKAPSNVSSSSSGSGSNQAPTNTAGANQGGGILGFIRKSIIPIVYRGETVHDATDNMGSENTLYFDKAQNRWIMPGEENAPVPSLLPPPKVGPGPPQQFSADSIQNQPSAASGPADYDPLAALMAPPPRQLNTNMTAKVSDDPLAALMAPPPRPTYSYSSASAPPANVNVFKPPVTANVWTPPTVTASLPPVETIPADNTVTYTEPPTNNEPRDTPAYENNYENNFSNTTNEQPPPHSSNTDTTSVPQNETVPFVPPSGSYGNIHMQNTTQDYNYDF